jgi:hypothetical protein
MFMFTAMFRGSCAGAGRRAAGCDASCGARYAGRPAAWARGADPNPDRPAPAQPRAGAPAPAALAVGRPAPARLCGRRVGVPELRRSDARHRDNRRSQVSCGRSSCTSACWATRGHHPTHRPGKRRDRLRVEVNGVPNSTPPTSPSAARPRESRLHPGSPTAHGAVGGCDPRDPAPAATPSPRPGGGGA